MEDGDSEALGRTLASKYRTGVVLQLANKPQIPTGLKDNTGYELASVSHALSELRDVGAVELLVPESQRKGRLYGLTDRGERVAEYVEEMRDEA